MSTRRKPPQSLGATVAALPRFGTDGWRAVIGDSFTFDNVRLVARALARHLAAGASGPTPVIAVGHDTRFLSPEFAAAAADAAAGAGAEVHLSPGHCPTPALSFFVRQRRLAAGIMITASHNPPAYNGVKFKAPYGGPAMAEMTRGVERCLHAIAGGTPVASKQPAKVRKTDFMPAYWRQVERFLDTAAMRRFRGRIVFNPMYGAGRGTVDVFLRRLGLDVVTLNDTANPGFGGLHGPEPIAANLADQAALVRRERAAVGLATDGDADRFGVLDGAGNFVQLHDLMPLLFRHLVRTRGWPGDVVRTTSMADTVDKMAAAEGRQVVEVPVGFKNVCEQMIAREVLIGGEESGGFGYHGHIPERDGVLSCLLLIEMLGASGRTIAHEVARLRRETGPFAYGRLDRYGDMDRLRANFDALRAAPPDRLAGLRTERVSLMDGIKFYFRGGGWMLMRLSDTEPLARIYVAADSDARVRRILAAGAKRLFG
jgi:phosphomannomutase